MKATHLGTCQICRRLQKIPGGSLATHGYEVSHGFFNGICPGSGYQPLEKSFKLLASTAKRFEAEISEWENGGRQKSEAAAVSDKVQMQAHRVRKAWISNAKFFVQNAIDTIKNWQEAPLKEVPSEEEVKKERKSREGIREAARIRDNFKRMLSKKIDGFSCAYLSAAKEICKDRGIDLEMAPNQLRALEEVGYKEQYYYASPNTSNVSRFLDKLEADKTQAPFVGILRPRIDEIRSLFDAYHEAKAKHESMKG